MSLSRKNYEAVAAIISSEEPFAVEDDWDPWDRGHETARRNISKALASYFASDNPRFDRDKFLRACGVVS